MWGSTSGSNRDPFSYTSISSRLTAANGATTDIATKQPIQPWPGNRRSMPASSGSIVSVSNSKHSSAGDTKNRQYERNPSSWFGTNWDSRSYRTRVSGMRDRLAFSLGYIPRRGASPELFGMSTKQSGQACRMASTMYCGRSVSGGGIRIAYFLIWPTVCANAIRWSGRRFRALLNSAWGTDPRTTAPRPSDAQNRYTFSAINPALALDVAALLFSSPFPIFAKSATYTRFNAASATKGTVPVSFRRSPLATGLRALP